MGTLGKLAPGSCDTKAAPQLTQKSQTASLPGVTAGGFISVGSSLTNRVGLVTLNDVTDSLKRIHSSTETDRLSAEITQLAKV